MDPEDKAKLSICCCACITFVGIILFAISWGSVEPTEWGLKYHSISKSIDNETGNFLFTHNGGLIYRFFIFNHKVYDGGRYIVGVFTSFVKFPRTLQTIEFSNRANANGKLFSVRYSYSILIFK